MSVRVSDPFGAVADPALPTLKLALDPQEGKRTFKRGLPGLAKNGVVSVKFIRVIRHKPGKRCVIEYDVRVERPGVPRRKMILVGKVRARRFGNEGYRLQRAIWQSGFGKDSAEGVSVPEPRSGRSTHGRSSPGSAATGWCCSAPRAARESPAMRRRRVRT